MIDLRSVNGLKRRWSRLWLNMWPCRGQGHAGNEGKLSFYIVTEALCCIQWKTILQSGNIPCLYLEDGQKPEGLDAQPNLAAKLVIYKILIGLSIGFQIERGHIMRTRAK